MFEVFWQAFLYFFYLILAEENGWIDFFGNQIFWERVKFLEELQIHVEKHHIKATDAISLKKMGI
mgnify:CR=1 FL=1